MKASECMLQIGLGGKIHQLMLEELNSTLEAKGLKTKAVHIRSIPTKTRKPPASPFNIVQFMGPAKEKRRVKKTLADLKNRINLIVAELSSAHQDCDMLFSADLSDIRIDSSRVGRGGIRHLPSNRPRIAERSSG